MPMFAAKNKPTPSPCVSPGSAGTRSCGTDRFAEGQEDLAPQDVEEVGWSGAVDDNPVAVVELAHVKIVQFLPRPARSRGISKNTRCFLASQLQQRGGKQHPEPFPPPSLPPTEHPESHRDPGEAPGVCPTLGWPQGELG